MGMEKNSIGTFLTALRKANGMTQKELAERLNVSDKAVSRWERDESYPDITQIPVIADIFGITSDELLRGERSDAGNPVKALERTEREIAHFSESVRSDHLIRTIAAITVAAVALIVRLVIYDKANTETYFMTKEATDAWYRKMDILDGIVSALSWGAFLAATAYVVILFLKAKEKLARIDSEDEPVTNAKRNVKLVFRISRWLLFIIFLLNLVITLQL